MTDAMPNPDHAAIDALGTLHNRSVDVLAGFETMVDKAEPEFRQIAERFYGLHQRHVTALAGLLAAAGQKADTDGTFMSTVNRTVVTLRSFFDEIDEDVMKQIESGERKVIEAFDDALAQDQTAEVHARLTGMRQELVHLLADAGQQARMS